MKALHWDKIRDVIVIAMWIVVLKYSRPNSVEDVVQQDEVVAVLKKTIAGSDVGCVESWLARILNTLLASKSSFLWATWYWQNLYHPRSC